MLKYWNNITDILNMVNEKLLLAIFMLCLSLFAYSRLIIKLPGLSTAAEIPTRSLQISSEKSAASIKSVARSFS